MYLCGSVSEIESVYSSKVATSIESRARSQCQHLQIATNDYYEEGGLMEESCTCPSVGVIINQNLAMERLLITRMNEVSFGGTNAAILAGSGGARICMMINWRRSLARSRQPTDTYSGQGPLFAPQSRAEPLPRSSRPDKRPVIRSALNNNNNEYSATDLIVRAINCCCYRESRKSRALCHVN